MEYTYGGSSCSGQSFNKTISVATLFDMFGSFAPCGGIILNISSSDKIVEIHVRSYFFNII